MNSLSRARRFFDTVRYLKPVQLVGRFWFRAYHPSPDPGAVPPVRKLSGHWVPGLVGVQSTTDFRHFRFLNIEGELHGRESWNDTRRDKLWLYNLHYFDFLHSGEGDAGAQAGIIKRWIGDNPPVGGNGWEPYPLSLRIVNWTKWHLSGNALDGEAIHSLAVQARYLAKRLEWHLLGNHLFANAKALVFAGVFFEGEEADAWLGKGLRILGEQAPEQVLEDGGHFELSPMYHGIVLEDLLDLVNLAGVYGVVGGRGKSRLSDWIPAFAGMTHTSGRGHGVFTYDSPGSRGKTLPWWECSARAVLVNWLQDLFPEVAVELGIRGLDGWPGRYLRRLRNASLNRARVNVVLGERMARRLVEEGVAEDRVRLIHNWADGEAIRPVAAFENPLRVGTWGAVRGRVLGESRAGPRVWDDAGGDPTFAGA
ncbi:MAG: heparinase II/III family protein [Pseudomonadota bacterium]|nr:heparinase II/III family protein [Pseudomonadota bacterium]